MSVPTTIASPTRQRLLDLWRILKLNRKVGFGLAVLVFFLLVAIFGPLLLSQDPNTFGLDSLQPPSAAHWLGTTQTGQDVLTQLVAGARISVFVGLLIGVMTMVISVVVGLIGGYFGGVIDEVLSVITNVFLVLPTLPLAILLAAFVSYKGTLTIAAVLTITGWSWGARVMRSQTLSMRNWESIEAARASGESAWHIIFVEILPNEIAIVMAQFLGTVIYAILAETGLEFLGLGDLSTVSWGTMLYYAGNADALLLGAWWWFLPPGLCIAILGAGLAFINFGIDEVANPRLRSEPRPLLRRLRKQRKAAAS